MEHKHVFPDEWILRALKDKRTVPEEKLHAFRHARAPSISEALLKTGLLSEEALAQLVMSTYQIPMASLKAENIDRGALPLIPEKVCRRRQMLPFKINNESILMAMSNPLDAEALHDAQTYSSRTPIPHFCLPGKLETLFNQIFSSEFYLQDLLNQMGDPLAGSPSDISSPKPDSLECDNQGNTALIVRLVDLIIRKAISMRASDIHLEHDEKKSLVRFRIDGLLKNILVLPKDIAVGPMVARIKILAEMDITDHYRPQDGRAVFKTRTSEVGFRVSILPTSFGEKIVMRVLDKKAAEVPFEKLGFRSEPARKISECLKAEQGIMLLTGPTGSGKTTTLYSILNLLKNEHINITTVEDPIEYKLDGINQVQVNEKQGLTFPIVLRSVLRQDPDIILVGEIRDLETAKIAVQAAMTGHLVFSTLHTNDALSTVERLRDIGIEPYKISSCLISAASQRLVRKLCPDCKLPLSDSETALFLSKRPPCPDMADRLSASGKPTLYKAQGCANCHFTGYRGQIPLIEIWQLDSETKKSIAAGEIKSTLEQSSTCNRSLYPLSKDAMGHLLEGTTSLDEVESFLTTAYSVGSFSENTGVSETMEPTIDSPITMPPVANTPPPNTPTDPPKKTPAPNEIASASETHNQAGKGTIDTNKPLAPTPAPSQTPAIKKRILVVDDDPTIQLVYKTILENEGHAVKTARNGIEAINLLLKEKMDLVLLDLMMPDMSGISVIKSIRQVMNMTDLPVIVLTAVSDDQIRNRILALGADDYLTKPSNPRVVLSRVNGLLMRTDSGEMRADVPRLLSSDDPLAEAA